MGALFLATLLALGGLVAGAWWWWERDRDQRDQDAQAVREWEELRRALAPPRSLP